MIQNSHHTDEVKEKISKALKGNKNAEKWSKALVIEILEAMLIYSNEDYEVLIKTKDEKSSSNVKVVKELVKRRIHLKKKLLIDFKLWNPEWFSDMRKRFKEEKTVSRLLSCIDMVCEVNTYEDASNSATNPVMAKMNLATHYGWADKTNLGVEDSRAKSDEELDKEIEQYNKRNKK